nr:MAG TPA: Terminase [Caudoviricetes sp.]
MEVLFLLASQSLISAVNSYDNYIQRKGIDEQVIDAYIEACRVAINGEKDITYGLQITNRSKGIIERFCMDRTGGRILDLEKYSQQHEEKYSLVDDYYKTLLIEAHYRFESFMLYMEKNRPVEERFYQPRINPLRQVAQLIQDLYDDVLDEGMVFCPGRIGKTQIVKMGNLWFGSNRPERSNLYSAYSDKITGGYYDGIIEMITDPTYTYAEIYPNIVEKKLVTDGKDLTVDLIRKKTYPTFTMRSIYGTLNGACDCDGLGVYDDLFSGIDEALSEDRQNTVWGKFDNNFMPRIKPGKAKLLGIGTRWAKKDVQGRRLDLLQNDPEYKGIRHREVIIPALNENGDSNFDYPYHLGYTTLDYKRRMASFENNDDMASWFAQYQQEPIERKGQMFNVDMMNFFNPAELEGIRPDRIFAANDPAYGGGDFVSMPICYEIDGEHYITDVVYNDGDKEITIPEVTSRMERHLDKFNNKTAEVHFEETKTTSAYRTDCEKIWEKDGYPINTSHDPADNQTAKMDRIKNHAPDIRKLHFVDMKYQTKEYRKYFQNILSATFEGKMKHDDGIDSTAQLCDMIYGNKRMARAEAIQNPFSFGRRY